MKTPNYKDILDDLQQASYKESLKAIFSFETGVDDESKLNELVNYYMDKDTIPNFLNMDILEKTKELTKHNNKSEEFDYEY